MWEGHNSAFQAIWTDLANQSTLLNGKGNVTRYDNAVANQTTIPAPYNIKVSSTSVSGRAKRYLLRLINTSFESNFIFSIDNHNITVVSTDFVPVQPYNTTNVTIGIGQRINVILIAQPIDSKAKSFWMRAYRPACFRSNRVLPSPGYEKAAVVFYDDEVRLPDWNPDPKAHPTGWPVNTANCTDEPYEKLKPFFPWTIGSKPANTEDHLAVQVQPAPSIFPLALFSIGGQEFNPFQIDYSNPIFLHFGYTGKWNPTWVVFPENYTSTDWVSSPNPTCDKHESMIDWSVLHHISMTLTSRRCI